MTEHITFLMHRTVWLMDAAADKILKRGFAISYRRFYFLLKVSLQPRCTQQALARQLGYSGPAVSRMADQLQRDGLLTVAKDPQHARRNCLSLTPKGRLLVDRASRELIQAFDRMMQSSGANLSAYQRTTAHIQQVLETCQADSKKKQEDV